MCRHAWLLLWFLSGWGRDVPGETSLMIVCRNALWTGLALGSPPSSPTTQLHLQVLVSRGNESPLVD